MDFGSSTAVVSTFPPNNRKNIIYLDRFYTVSSRYLFSVFFLTLSSVMLPPFPLVSVQ